MGAVTEQTYAYAHTFPAVAESVPRVRRALVDFAWEAGADQQQVDALGLAVSEAVTNAVRHAYGEGFGEVHVTAALAGDELWVLVGDDGHGLKAPSHSPGLGMGLALIASVSDYFAVVTRASGGTELRMRFRLRADDQAGGTKWAGIGRLGALRGLIA